MEHLFGIDRRRPLPEFKRETLRKWFARRPNTPAASAREVVLYADAYTNHVRTGRGKAAVRTLEALGAHVHLPRVPDSGRAPLSQDMIAAATRRAEAVWRALAEHVEAGRDVVVIEPSDLAMFKRDYEKLLPEAAFQQLHDRSFDVMAYIERLVQDGASTEALCRGGERGVAYHSHCQQRTLGLEAPTVALLKELGYDVQTSDVECCGMAGSFGYKAEYYELSMKVGGRAPGAIRRCGGGRTRRGGKRHLVPGAAGGALWPACRPSGTTHCAAGIGR